MINYSVDKKIDKTKVTMSRINNNENIEPNIMLNQNETNDELVIIHEIINSQPVDPYSTGM